MTLSGTKRASILDAAAAEFTHSGYQATSMDRIAATAGVSKRTVYNHFPSKEELFRAIVEELLEQARRVTDHPYQRGVALEEQLRGIAEREVALIASQEFLGLVRAIISECIRTPRMAAEVMGRLQGSHGCLEGWIRDATADGQLEVPDPELASEQLMALIKGPLFWPQVIGGVAPTAAGERRRIVDAAIAIWLHHYRPR
jgi:TetR/AcrR family transcriptional regulator of autoinduction and epiphytic fitness